MRHFKQTMRLSTYILTIAFLATLFSCDRLKRKGHNVVEKTQEKIIETKQKIKDKKNQLVDNVFPTYDNGKPDTENNKKRFKEHLQVDLTNDVKNIYTYGDFLGADYKVLISFSCDTTTLKKIVKAKAMTISTKDNDEGLLFSDEFPWWDKKVIAKIKPFKIGKEFEYWQYLWFDKISNTAYYEEFSL